MFASAHLWRTWPGGRGSQHLCYHGNESLAGCKTCWPACRAINRLLSAESDNFAVNSNAAHAGGQSETLASPPRRYSNFQTNVADFSCDQSTGFCGLAVYRPREKSQTLDIFFVQNEAIVHWITFKVSVIIDNTFRHCSLSCRRMVNSSQSQDRVNSTHTRKLYPK